VNSKKMKKAPEHKTSTGVESNLDVVKKKARRAKRIRSNGQVSKKRGSAGDPWGVEKGKDTE